MGSRSIPAIIKTQASLPWLSAIVVIAIAAGLSFTLHFPRPTSIKGAFQFGQDKLAAGKLAMRVEEHDDRILLQWNRDNGIVRSSTGGVLRIDDGSQHHNLQLDPALLASGSILYRAESDDVSFRLEIYGRRGELVTGSVRMLDGTKLSSSAPITERHRSETIVTVAEPATSSNHPSVAILKNKESQLPVTTLLRSKEILKDTSSPPGQNPLDSSPSASSTLSPTEAPAPGATAAVPLQSSLQEVTPSVTLPKPVAEASSPQELTPTPSASAADSAEDAKTRQDNARMPSPVEAPADKVVKSTPPTSLSGTAPEMSLTKAKAGSLSAGAVVPCKPIRQVTPDLRKLGMTTATLRSLQIEVAVRVNDRGGVTEARLLGEQRGVPSYLAFAALDAAKQWTFEPATLRGHNIASDHTIVFKFRSDHH